MKNLTSFDSGNRIGLKLTSELHAQFVAIVAQTGRISVASGKCGLGVSTARHWMARGRQEESGIYRDFLDAVERARSEFLAVAAKRLAQLAIGGTIDLPKFDKQNQIIRDANDEIVFEERFFPPNPNALMHILDRIDPSPNGDPPPLGVPMAPELSDAEQLAEAAAHYDLFSEVFRTMRELGYPGLDRLVGNALAQTAAIETSAVQVPQPAPAKEDVAASDVLKPETPTEPKPGRPKFEDAF